MSFPQHIPVTPYTIPRALLGRLLKYCIFSCFLSVGTLVSAPMITIGDTASIHVSAEAEFQYLSNVTLATDDAFIVDDAMFKFTPGFSFGLFEESQVTDFTIGANRGMLHFFDHTAFNEEPWGMYMHTGYKGYPFAFSMDWKKQEQLQNITSFPALGNPTNDILQTIVEDFQMNFDLSFSPKLGIRTGVQWHITDYKDPIYLDSELFSLPLTFFYKISSKLESSVGYRFRTVESGTSSEHNDHYINLNLIGQVSSKTYLHLTLGFQNRNSDYVSFTDSISSNTFSANLGVTYNATEKLKLESGLFRDFNVGSVDGISVEYTSAYLGSTFYFTPTVFLGTKASVWTAQYDYPNNIGERKDFGANSRTVLTLAPNDSPWLYRAGYHFDWAEFEISGSSDNYTNHKISLSTSYEY
jgi:hypothetical protein